MTYNLVGFKTRELVVIEKSLNKTTGGKTLWKCQCLCGNFTELPTFELTKIGGTRSCGRCEWHIKHKDAYISWMSMKQRCDDSSRKDYKYYGGRGIKYCKEWGNFVPFFKDMGDPPLDQITGERLSLDRKEVNGMYCKDNCRWSTRSEQQLNKTTQQKQMAEEES